MSKVRAKVKPELLVWARESAGFSQAEAAKKAAVGLESLVDWESSGSEAAPSIPQLRKLAALYKRPLAVLYLSEPPTKFMALKDFRRLPGGGIPDVPPEVVLESRLARERREAVISLAIDAGMQIEEFPLQASLEEDAEAVGDRIRKWLEISLPLSSMHKDAYGHKALKYWRSAIEKKDVLVWQSSRFSSDIVSGFAIFEKQLPIVVVSRKDASPRRRLFSLLHEFTHLLLRSSGISEIDINADLSKAPEEQRVEIFCNAVAAASLLPRDLFLRNSTVGGHSGDEWSDAELESIGRDFGVSREAVLRRLLSFKRTSKQFYEATRERYLREWREQRDRDKSGRQEGIPRNMANEAFSDLGRRFVWLVLDRFYHDRLTLSDVAGHFGVKTKHIPAIEQMSRRSL